MKRTLLSALILLVTLNTTFGFVGLNTERDALKTRVISLLQERMNDVHPDDQVRIRLRMREIEGLFADNGIYAERNIESRMRLICDDSKNKLIDLNDRSRVIHDFNKKSHCLEAKTNVENGSHFCDYNDNTLRTPSARLVYDFNDSDSCRSAIRRVNRGLDFCDYDDNTLREPNGRLIHDFDTKLTCTAALER